MMYDEAERPITTAEAVREWVWVVGAERTDTQWLLSDYDTWERNPHYTGPAQRHPEDYDPNEENEWSVADSCNAAVDEYLDLIEQAEQADYEAALIERELSAERTHPGYIAGESIAYGTPRFDEYSWPDYTRGDSIW